MRILLIRPNPPPFTIGLKSIMVCEPLELEYIAAGLEGHEVQILDMILEPNLNRRLKSFNPDMVGTSSYITGVRILKEICRKVKEFNPDILTIAGGVHASLVPGDFDDENIDLIVCGDGIPVIRKIVERYENREDFKGIPGVITKESSSGSTGHPANLKTDTSDLPMPRRDLIEKYSRNYYYLFHQPVSLVKTVYGCPFSCNFCYCWKLTGGKVYSRPVDSVIEELRQIRNREVYFIDDTFLISPDRIMQMHDQIRKEGIDKNYLIYGHSDFIVNHPDIIKAWAGIGLKACIVGLESPRDDELDKYRKRATVEKNNQAIQILRRNNIDIYASLIVDPHWNHRDFRMLYDYIQEQDLYYIVIQPLTPLPGTDLFEEYKDKLIISREMYELWDMQHLVMEPDLPPKAFYREIRKLYLSTFFDLRRTRNLQLRTVPPVWSRKYLRLLSGCMKIYLDLRNAHLHPGMLLKNEVR